MAYCLCQSSISLDAEGFSRCHLPWFEYAALAVIGVNSIWMAVDVDNNPAELIIEAEPVFIAADNLFCFLFALERGYVVIELCSMLLSISRLLLNC